LKPKLEAMKKTHVPTFSISFSGGAGNNTTDYNESSATNPTVMVFSAASISINSSSSGDRLATLVLNKYRESIERHVVLPDGRRAERGDASGWVTLSFDSATGDITFAFSGAGSAPTASTWDTILDGLQYTNTADEPLGTTHAITLVSATPASGS
jgi:hypothetical protein